MNKGGTVAANRRTYCEGTRESSRQFHRSHCVRLAHIHPQMRTSERRSRLVCVLACFSLFQARQSWPCSETDLVRVSTYWLLASSEDIPLREFQASHLARASICTAHG